MQVAYSAINTLLRFLMRYFMQHVAPQIIIRLRNEGERGSVQCNIRSEQKMRVISEGYEETS
jgi:hypothetical protein